jgi:hypothetical protein
MLTKGRVESRRKQWTAFFDELLSATEVQKVLAIETLLQMIEKHGEELWRHGVGTGVNIDILVHLREHVEGRVWDPHEVQRECGGHEGEIALLRELHGRMVELRVARIVLTNDEDAHSGEPSLA